jgi:hypothetical protein
LRPHPDRHREVTVEHVDRPAAWPPLRAPTRISRQGVRLFSGITQFIVRPAWPIRSFLWRRALLIDSAVQRCSEVQGPRRVLTILESRHNVENSSI